MLRYLFLDKVFTVFFELHSEKVVPFLEQIMPTDKYLSKFPRQVIVYLYNNQINARTMIGQSTMVYSALSLQCMENPRVFELLYKSNTPQVSMVYRLINHLEYWKTLREFIDH